MKISLLIPKETQGTNLKQFIDNEISSSRNIQSKQTRDSVLASLTKIRSCL